MLVTLLGMDSVQPYFALMGFEPPDERCLEGTLRRLFSEAFGGEPDYGLACVTRACGSSSADVLGAWGRHTFSMGPEDHRELESWMWLLRRARHDPARWRRLGLDDAALRELNHAVDMTEYRFEQQLQKDVRLSDWDLHVYAICLFDDDAEDAPNGPDTYLYPSILIHRARRFWRRLLTRYDASQLAHLHRAALEISAEDSALKSVLPLCPPGLLLSVV